MRCLSPLLVALALVPSAVARADEATDRALEEATTALVASLTAAEPRVRSVVTKAAPRALGYNAAGGDLKPLPARRFVLSTPAGVERSLGLFPRRGLAAMAPFQAVRPTDPDRLVAAGPDLIIIDVAPEPPPALTLEALEAGRALLERALSALGPWRRPLDVQPAPADLGLAADVRVVAYPHVLWVEHPPGARWDVRTAAARHGLVYERSRMSFTVGP